MSDTTWNDAIERAVRDLLVALGVDPDAPPLVATATPEPDPWPTEPLIVADWIAGGLAKRHGLAYLDGHEYVTVESGRVLRYGRDTLTNVVPVHVVPVAEMRHAREMLAAADAGDFDSFIGSFRKLITATDALGLDQ